MAYVEDTLLEPPKADSRFSAIFKKKRMYRCINSVTYLLTRHLEEQRPDLFEWLNTMEMINCGVLRQDATRDYRLFQILSYQQQLIDEIVIVFMENAVLTKTRLKYDYEEWFAEKVIFICATLRQIHQEHTDGHIRLLDARKSRLQVISSSQA